jgi:NAD(P)-dependent dehydrogenase (short-subunit alcohol dehydrogenase family)
MMADFTDQVVLIAGAPGALGVGIAETFRAQGATVLIAPGPACRPSLVALYAGFMLVEGEVGEPGNLELRCGEITAQHGRLDLVIFCNGTDLPRREGELPARKPPREPHPLLRRLCAMMMAIC